MKTTNRAERQLHHTQTWANSCQAACLAIAVAARTGQAVAALEAQLHGTPFRGNGHPINTIGHDIAGRRSLRCLARDAALLLNFRQELQRGARIVVHVGGPLWVALHLPHRLEGPHGALCPPGERMKPIHSVVIVAEEPGRFFILDPFLDPGGQPLEVTDDELRHVLAGFDAVVV